MTQEKFNYIVFNVLFFLFSSLFGVLFYGFILMDGGYLDIICRIADIISKWQTLIVGVVAISAAYYGVYQVWIQIGYNRYNIIKQKIAEFRNQRREILKFQTEIMGVKSFYNLFAMQRWAEEEVFLKNPPVSMEVYIQEYAFRIEDLKSFVEPESEEMSKSLESLGECIIEFLKSAPDSDVELPKFMVEREEYYCRNLAIISKKVIECAGVYELKIKSLASELFELEMKYYSTAP